MHAWNSGMGAADKGAKKADNSMDKANKVAQEGISKVNKQIRPFTNKLSQIQQKIRGNLQKHDVYPWNNHDFDYSTLVSNQYNPKALGISDTPCPDTFVDDLFSLEKYGFALIQDALPNSGDKAGISDADVSNTQMNDIKKTYTSWGEPYSGFSLEYPDQARKLSGKYASSYFVKTGTCPVNSIKTKQACEDRGFKWVNNASILPTGSSSFFPGHSSTISEETNAPSGSSCHQPRYSFVDNSGKGLSGMDGLVPTIGKEVTELNPIALFNIAMSGSSSSGDFAPLPCREAFMVTPEGKNRSSAVASIIGVIGVLLLLMLFISCISGISGT